MSINPKSMYQFLMDGLSRDNYLSNKPIIFFKGKTIRVKQFINQIDKTALILTQMGIKKGDVVAINLPNMLSAIVVFYAVNKCGAVANLIHPKEPFNKFISLVNFTETKLIITYHQYYKDNYLSIKEVEMPIILCRICDDLPFVKKLIYRVFFEFKHTNYKILHNLVKTKKVGASCEPIYHDEAVYLHSAGTTGEPKTVILSNKALNSLHDSLLNVIPNMDVNHNKCITVLPLFHGFGLGICMHAMLSQGFEVILEPKFDPKKFAVTAFKTKATICAGVPYMYEKLVYLNDKYFSKLRTIENMFVGGDKLYYGLKSCFDQRLKSVGSKAELLEGYGLTEAVTVICVNKPGDYKTNCMGSPLNGIKILIVNENDEPLPCNTKGEICVGGETVMEGYLKDEETNAEIFFTCDGVRFVRTGDIGYTDEDGRLFFFGRKKRMFKISGVPVFPSEIENAVLALNIIKNALAVYKNKIIVLYIELNKEIDEATAVTAIEDVCKKSLIMYARPSKIAFVQRWERNSVGKITGVVEIKSLYSLLLD